MRILITGSNGLLGQKLVHLLLKQNNVNLLATSKGENRISLKDGYSYKNLDITNQQEVEAVVGNFEPNIIINTAAMTNVDACENDKEQCWLLNVTAVEYLLKAAKKNQTHFIHLSTDFVFDGKAGPYAETDQPNPVSYYGKSKLAAEKLVAASTTSWSIVRTIIVFGVGEKMSRSNIVLWAKDALAKGEPLTIVNDQLRSPTLAEDLAMGCWLITQQKATGIYHISGKDMMSIIDLVYAVADFYGYDKSIVSPISSSVLNQAAKRPPKTGFILDKAINKLGYQPHSFKEGLALISEQLK